VAAFRQPLHQDPHAVSGSARVIGVGVVNGEENSHVCVFSARVDYRCIPMIHYLARSEHNYPVGDYLKSWAGPSHPVIKIFAYERLPTILPRGTYVFSDLERLTSSQSELKADLRDQLAAAGDGIRLLNHPTRSLRRFALLRELSEVSKNEGFWSARDICDESRGPMLRRSSNFTKP
jgi:hypothetical protein